MKVFGLNEREVALVTEWSSWRRENEKLRAEVQRLRRKVARLRRRRRGGAA